MLSASTGTRKQNWFLRWRGGCPHGMKVNQPNHEEGAE